MDYYLIMWNYLKINRKEKGKGLLFNWDRTATVQQAQRGNSPAHGRLRVRQVSNLTGGAQASASGERDEGEERLIGGARLSSLTLQQRAGELIGGDSGHDMAS